MSETRRYDSPTRAAQAAATRAAILDAFVEQLVEPGRDNLSPKEAAARAGCSVRTVHSYFPSAESRIVAIAEHLEDELFPERPSMPSGPDDLVRHYRDIHRSALTTRLAAPLLAQRSETWAAVRKLRRQPRLDAVRAAVEAIGAPAAETRRAIGILLVLAGGEVTLALRDEYGLSDDDAVDAIAATVADVVERLRQAAIEDG